MVQESITNIKNKFVSVKCQYPINISSYQTELVADVKKR